MRVAEHNADQGRAWDGEEGRHWAEHADWYEAVAAGYDGPLFDAAGIAATDRVLDLGCGTGSTTRQAARLAAAGSALGIDLSTRMVERARELAHRDGVGNATFVAGDAQVHPFGPAAFDVAVSRTGAAFFGDPVAAFTNVATALRPGGRLALVTWRPLAENRWLGAIRDALAAGRDLPAPPVGAPGPFGLADPGTVRRILGAAGFTGVAVEAVDRPVRLGADADDALRHLSGSGVVRGLLDGLAEPDAAAGLAALGETLAAHTTPDGVSIGSAAWLVTARRPR